MLLSEESALQRTEAECLQDASARERARERAAKRWAELDQECLARFASQIRELFPKCSPGRKLEIAGHACQKYSGRVGHSANAKAPDEKAVRLAVVAHIRHAKTNYDKLLAGGMDRHEARDLVRGEIDEIIDRWKG